MNDRTTAQQVTEAPGDAVDAASGAVRAASEAVSDRVDQVTRSTQDLADDAAALIQRYPVRSALIAAGFVAVAGIVVGYLMGRRS